jgi:hypothetical protein
VLSVRIVSTSLYRRNLQMGSPARDPEPTAAYRPGVIGEEGPGEGWGGFSIVTCPLSIARGSQGNLCPGTGSGKQGISVRGRW